MGHSFQFSFRWGNNIVWSIVSNCILVFRYNCVWHLTCTGWNMDSFSLLLVCIRLACRQSARTNRFLLHSLFFGPSSDGYSGSCKSFLGCGMSGGEKKTNLRLGTCAIILLFDNIICTLPLCYFCLLVIVRCRRYSRLVNSVGPLFYSHCI